MNQLAVSLAPPGPSTWPSALDLAPAAREMLPIAVYACDHRGRILWFNRRAAALWGREPRLGDDGELFCGAHKVYHLDHTPIDRDATPMAQVLRSGQPVHGQEAAIERPDGTRSIAAVHIDPVHDEAGKLIGAINCLHDTTELHQARLQTADSEQRMRQLLEALPAAVYTTDAAGRITFFNRAAVELSGRRPELGSDQWCVTWRLHTADGKPLPHDECPMAIALKENRAIRGVEAVAERPDGGRVPFLPFPTPLRDASGAVVGAVNMLVDISERKSAESRQKVLLDELNHRVKNNLQLLHSLLRVAQRDAPHGEARAVLADACQRVAAMAAAQHVLHDTTDLVKFDARSFLDAVCASATQAFAKHVRIDIEAASGALSTDMAMPLALIVNELLTNAVKHGLQGRAGTVRVGLTRADGGLELYVADDGPGFTLDQVRRSSSGLGLVIGLAGQLRGRFGVEWQNGARCYVRFPGLVDG